MHKLKLKIHYLYLFIFLLSNSNLKGQSNKQQYEIYSEKEYRAYFWPLEDIGKNVIIYNHNTFDRNDTIKNLIVYPIVACEDSFKIDRLFPNLEHLYIRTNCKFLDLGKLNRTLKYFGFGCDWEDESMICFCNRNYEWFPQQVYSLKKVKELNIGSYTVLYIPEKIAKLKQVKEFSISTPALSFPISPLIKTKHYPKLNFYSRFQFHLKDGSQFIPIADEWRFNSNDELIQLPKNGIFENYWTTTNSLLVKGNFKKGKPDGAWKFWYANGQQWNVRNYNNGMETGTWIYFANNGDTVLVEKFIEGNLWYYSTYEYKNNENDYWEFVKRTFIDSTTAINSSLNIYENEIGIEETIRGDYKRINYFSNDTILGYIEFNKNNDSSIAKFHHGSIYTWHNNGFLKEFINYKDNKKNGLRILFNEQGKVIRRELYENDNLINSNY